MTDYELLLNVHLRSKGEIYDKAIEDIPYPEILERITKTYFHLHDICYDIISLDTFSIANLESRLISFQSQVKQLHKRIYNLKRGIKDE